MNETTKPDSALARLAIYLAAIWLATGALAKLFVGTPALLPEVVREHTPFGLDLTYMLVIGVELSVVFLAFLRPRNAWPVLVAMYVFFDIILTMQLRAGAKSCGCFGDGMEVSPALMMAVDSALLLFLLATKPWARLRTAGASPLLVLLAAAVSFALPPIHLRARTAAPDVPGPVKPTDGTPAPVQKLPDWVTLDPAQWVGKSVWEIEDLTRWVEADKLPTDGKLVLWRQGCDHCAPHLRDMANRDKGDQPIVLIQVMDDLKSSRLVDALPEGPHVTQLHFPEGLQFVLQTPWELIVQGGNVTEAVSPEQSEARLKNETPGELPK